MNEEKILIVDDEKSMCEMLSIMLERQGYTTKAVSEGSKALQLLKSGEYSLVISDLRMPDIDGIELLKNIREFLPDIPVIVMTAYTSLTTAVEAIRLGAFDYIQKPFQKDFMNAAVSRALENSRLKKDNSNLRESLARHMGRDALDNFIGNTAKILALKKYVRKIAPTDTNVLITGESGTGKDVLARAIHQLSLRRDKPFIAINCGALPETLLESELFGYVKGAFTGASKNKTGLLMAADGGTFFLDEIGETSPSIQVKLLRAIENRTITPVGSTQTLSVDVRIIAATNADLETMTQDNRFRSDLYYRLKVFHIHIPPLRERKDDIIPISNALIKRLAIRHNLQTPGLNEQAGKLLESYSWEGNVRELDNVLEQAIVLSNGEEIQCENLPDYINKEKQSKGIVANSTSESAFAELPTMETIEKAYIFWVLNETGWKKSDTARILGIDASTLYRKIDRYGLKKNDE